MRLSGTLKSWKDDRGFGFITPTHGGAELFVHISSLPRDGSRPTVGEKVTYELERGNNGRPQAVNVLRTAIGRPIARPRVREPGPKRTRSSLTRIIGIALVIALGAFGYQQYQKRLPVASSQFVTPTFPRESAVVPATSAQAFKCDGRTHCSQMTSCTEAKFFLKNCPGTKMDGNNDGIPCEPQWCTSMFSK